MIRAAAVILLCGTLAASAQMPLGPASVVPLGPSNIQGGSIGGGGGGGQFVLLADAVNKVLLVNGVAKICLVGTC